MCGHLQRQIAGCFTGWLPFLDTGQVQEGFFGHCREIAQSDAAHGGTGQT